MLQPKLEEKAADRMTRERERRGRGEREGNNGCRLQCRASQTHLVGGISEGSRANGPLLFCHILCTAHLVRLRVQELSAVPCLSCADMDAIPPGFFIVLIDKAGLD